MITNASQKVVELDRHLNCLYYGCGLHCPFRTFVIQKEEEMKVENGSDFMFVFVEAVATDYSFEDEEERHHQHGDYFFFLGPGSSATIYSGGRETAIRTFTFTRPNQLCENYEVARLKSNAPTSHHFIVLPTHEGVKMALDSAVYMHEHKLNCLKIYEVKLREIFFYIGAFYEPDDVAMLLAPLLKEEIDFKRFVLDNFLHAKTVEELAEKLGMPERDFKKKFQETFRMPPYSWMLKEKAKHIDSLLADPEIPFSDIIENYGFSSPSHFTVFCRRQFDMTPSARRRLLIAKKKLAAAE